MYEFVIVANEYLQKDIIGFYHADYVGYKKHGNPDYINTLKNTYNSFSQAILISAIQELKSVLLDDFPRILQKLQVSNLTVCVVPRAKAETNYQANQLLFKTTIRNAISQLNGFDDGTDYIMRHTNTKTTHLPAHTPNYNNDGQRPYSGITTETCNISSNVKGKDILLIDDLYTKTVNIDEDAIQALLNNGAYTVTFYAIGCTVSNK